ncbi:hypothetical protein [Pseudomonas gingeri]|uniref:hypothetical protein n=1 Tax=Pseudomonas gingeri TaxID=117681 RepID=UPI00210AEF60|nr:hypothetical protein [Pseudomonas gingeri]
MGVPLHRLLLATDVDGQRIKGAGRRSILDVSGEQALKLKPGKHSLKWCWLSMNALGTGGALCNERSLPRQLGPGYNALSDLQAVRNKAKTTGQVIAELKFVFWEKTFTSRHDSRIWEPQMMRVLPNLDAAKTVAQHRKRIFDDLNQVRRLRNRIAHHEPIFMRNLLDGFQTIQRLVEARCQVSADWMVSQQQVTDLIRLKPSKVL